MRVDLLDDFSHLAPVLRKLDEQVAAEARKRGCACGGKLHQANYPRKLRGLPQQGEDGWQRLSFCCAKEGCRRRTTPPSVMFLGRKVYPGAVIVLVSVLRQKPTAMRLSRLKELVGVSSRTVRRWRRWWLRNFVQSRFWKAARGWFRVPLDELQLPLVLLEAFEVKPPPLQLVQMLRFLGPLTSRTAATQFEGPN